MKIIIMIKSINKNMDSNQNSICSNNKNKRKEYVINLIINKIKIK